MKDRYTFFKCQKRFSSLPPTLQQQQKRSLNAALQSAPALFWWELEVYGQHGCTAHLLNWGQAASLLEPTSGKFLSQVPSLKVWSIFVEIMYFYFSSGLEPTQSLLFSFTRPSGLLPPTLEFSRCPWDWCVLLRSYQGPRGWVPA